MTRDIEKAESLALAAVLVLVFIVYVSGISIHEPGCDDWRVMK